MQFPSRRTRLSALLAGMLLLGLVWGSGVQAQTFQSTYQAQPGDTHQSIAAKHGISVALLHSLNPQIEIYRQPAWGTVYLVPTVALTGSSPGYCPQLHTVNPRESLAWIADAYHISVAELARLNNLDVNAPIYDGYVLCLPANASLSGFVGSAAPASGAVPTGVPAAVPSLSPTPATTQVGPWTGYYYNYLRSSAPVLTREDVGINFDWGAASPGLGVGFDNFSAIWQGNYYFSGQNYRFTALTDDGVRVWVGGVLVLDGWKEQSTTLYFKDYAPPRGIHLVQVEYYESGIDANISVNWTQN